MPRGYNQHLPHAERVSVVSNAEGARLASQEAHTARSVARGGIGLPAQRAICEHRGPAQQHDAFWSSGSRRRHPPGEQPLPGDVHVNRPGATRDQLSALLAEDVST